MIAFIIRTLVVVVALSTCVGCVSQRDRAVVAANVTGDITEAAHDAIAHHYQRSLDACLTLPTRQDAEACALRVNHAYGPAWRAYVATRAVWVALWATVQAIDLLGRQVPDSELLAQMLAVGEAATDLQQAIRMLDVEDER